MKRISNPLISPSDVWTRLKFHRVTKYFFSKLRFSIILLSFWYDRCFILVINEKMLDKKNNFKQCYPLRFQLKSARAWLILSKKKKKKWENTELIPLQDSGKLVIEEPFV